MSKDDTEIEDGSPDATPAEEPEPTAEAPPQTAPEGGDGPSEGLGTPPTVARGDGPTGLGEPRPEGMAADPRLKEEVHAFTEALHDGRWEEAIGHGDTLIDRWGANDPDSWPARIDLPDALPKPKTPRRVRAPKLQEGSRLAPLHGVVVATVGAFILDESRPTLERYQRLHGWLDGLHERLPQSYYRSARPFLVGWKRTCYARIPAELQDYRVDRDEVLTRVRPKLTGFERFMRFLWAQLNLLVRCPLCPPKERCSRDILGEGECWFKARYQEEALAGPLWIGSIEQARLARIALAKRRRGLPLMDPAPSADSPCGRGPERVKSETVNGRPRLKLWTIPNALTLTRVALLPGIVIGIQAGTGLGYFIAFILACLGEITDFTDGHIARVRGETSPLGKLLDPMADTITRFSIFLALHSVGLVPFWMVLLLFVRDMSIAYLRSFAASNGIVMGARTSGKVKAVFQGVATLLILLMMMHTRYHQETHTTGELVGWLFAALGCALLPQVFTALFKIRGLLLWLIRGATVACLTLIVLARLRVFPAFDPAAPVWVLMLIVTLVTTFSLGDYFRGFVLALRKPVTPQEDAAPPQP